MRLIETGRALASHGLVVGAAGNISAAGGCEGLDWVLISGRGTDLGCLRDGDFALLSPDGEQIAGEAAPTSEQELHLRIYGERSDVRAVVHTHSPHATALAVLGESIPPIVDEMTIVLGGVVKLAAYGPPGSREIAENALEALEDRMAVLLANHGALALGRDPAEALKIAHMLEHLAQVYLLARQGGAVREIPAAAYERQRAIYLKRKER